MTTFLTLSLFAVLLFRISVPVVECKPPCTNLAFVPQKGEDFAGLCQLSGRRWSRVQALQRCNRFFVHWNIHSWCVPVVARKAVNCPTPTPLPGVLSGRALRQVRDFLVTRCPPAPPHRRRQVGTGGAGGAANPSGQGDEGTKELHSSPFGGKGLLCFTSVEGGSGVSPPPAICR